MTTNPANLRGHSTSQEEGGRGLLLIAACAKDWGVKNWPDGRSVWAELAWEGA